jgi:Holliday junction resolvase-like predicted endonuclease
MQYSPQNFRSRSSLDSIATRSRIIRSHYAEELICRKLTLHQWTIIGQNLRGRGYELDIVATKSKVLKIVEVKYRNLNSKVLDLSAAESLINRKKIVSLQRGALAVIEQKDLRPESIHFDLAVVGHSMGRERISYFGNFLGS